jgi:MFS family permease
LASDCFSYNIRMERTGLIAALRNTTFRSLRHRNYRLYFLGQIVSFIGSQMQSAALMWLMYDRTGDPRWPSWILVAQVGPTILLGTWGGGLADRYPKRSLIFVTQAAFLVHAVILTLLLALNLAGPWLILGFMVVSGVIQAVDLPARLAFVTDLVPREDLTNAVGLNSLLFNSARAIGPALAALVFRLADLVVPLLPEGTQAVTLGAVLCFALNAVSFLAVLVALWGIKVEEKPIPKTRGATAWDGVRYLVENRSLGGLMLITLVVCIFGWPLITVLPSYTRLQLGLSERVYGLLVSAVGAGALVAALTTATFGSAERRGQFLILGAASAAVGLFGMSQTNDPWLAALGCAVLGFGLILYLSTGQSTLQLAVPDDKRGRVLALWAMSLSASAPLGHLLAGQAVAAFGIEVVLLGMASGVGVSALTLAAMIRIRKVEK